MKKSILLFTVIHFSIVQVLSANSIFQDTSAPIKILPDTTNLTLDYLKVPASAAFNLMGIAPTTIEEPKVPGDFIVALNNATNDFTEIPRSYALEFSPGWVFNKENIDFSNTISNKLGQNLKQSLVLSMGINSIDDPIKAPGNMGLTQVGFGVKASLLRGTVKSEFEAIDSLYQTLGLINDAFYENMDKWLETDSIYKSLSDSILIVQIQLQANNELAASLGPVLSNLGNKANERSAFLLQDTEQFEQEVTSKFAGHFNTLKSNANNIKYIREGFKLDFAAGFVSDFRNGSFDSTRVSKIGTWLTGGWTFDADKSDNASSILGVLRLTGNPDQLYKAGNSLLTDNNLFFDFGGRLIFHNGERLSISGELVGRIPVNNDLLESTSRYTFNLEYQASNSIILSLNLGKDFNGTVSNSGNLLTALHLFSYFGNRSYNNNGQSTK